MFYHALVFKTSCRPCSRIFRVVPEEGFEPPRPKTLVPKTSVSAVPPLGPKY